MGTRGGSGQEIMRQIAGKTRTPGREVNREEMVKKADEQAKRDSSSKKRK